MSDTNPFSDDGRGLFDSAPSPDSATAPVEKADKPAPKTSAKRKTATKAKSEEPVTFDAAVSDLGVLSATAGQIVASIDQNQVSVPVLRVSLVGWVGTAPIEVSANDGVEDLISALESLRDQAKKHAAK